MDRLVENIEIVRKLLNTVISIYQDLKSVDSKIKTSITEFLERPNFVKIVVTSTVQEKLFYFM